MSEVRQGFFYRIGQFLASTGLILQQQLEKVVDALNLSSTAKAQSSDRSTASSTPTVKMKVLCSACGREHTLQAVCGMCGVVLCSRCQRSEYQEGVGQVVLCPSCLANLSVSEEQVL